MSLSPAVESLPYGVVAAMMMEGGVAELGNNWLVEAGITAMVVEEGVVALNDALLVEGGVAALGNNRLVEGPDVSTVIFRLHQFGCFGQQESIRQYTIAFTHAI